MLFVSRDANRKIIAAYDLPNVLGRQLLRQKVSGYNPLIDEGDII